MKWNRITPKYLRVTLKDINNRTVLNGNKTETICTRHQLQNIDRRSRVVFDV
jgi:hypothetical protein